MAIKPTENEAFYREVDEELRKEQMSSFWQRHGKLVILGVILLLAAIAGYLWWQNEKQAQAAARGEALLAVFDDIQAGRTQNAAQRLDQVAQDAPDGYRAAAMLTKGDLAVQANNDPAAVAAFKAVAEDEGLATPYRNLALIRQTAVEFDRLPPAAVIERLRPLAVAGNPWFGSAGEMVAIAYMKMNRPQLAAPIFAAIAADETLPGSIRSRAVQMAGSLGVDAIPDTADNAPGNAATEVPAQ